MTKPEIQRARALRKSMPKAEALLWTRLRRRQLDGHRFRRQHPVGPFIIDFACLERALFIELDGDQHGYAAARRHDAQRTAYLEGLGFAVIRFWNREVYEDPEGVVWQIREALQGPPG